MSGVPIGAHALLSDCHSAALVTRDGSVDWLCFPRFDSPSVFGRLLDDGAGHWSITPVGEHRTLRGYADQTLVLETTFHTSTGTAVLTDALATGEGNHGHALGQGAPHLLIRGLRGLDGELEFDLHFRPRPEYGLLQPLLSSTEGGVTVRGGAEWLVLSSPVPMELEEGEARARLTVRGGQELWFALHRSTLEQRPARVWSEEEIAARMAGTIESWRSWSKLHQRYEGPWRELVHHSGRVLQGLTFQPSGAIVAAPTTSLPEEVGGERNWDYRYSWVRDASFTMQALWVAACPDEAESFFAFMTTAAAGTLSADRPLQIMYGVGGEHDLSERTLPRLHGWRGSRPVRVGNGAWDQQQIDVYGELLDAAYRLERHIETMDDDMRAFLVALADTAARRCHEPDQGIWEVRGGPRHFTYSKVMCWVALDRAIRLADRLGSADRVPAWTRARDELHATVLSEGWNERVGAFTQYFGGDELDASCLMLPITGFLPATDPRVVATVEAIADRLTDERGLVYRYRAEAGVDGLAGGEGTFLLCTFWLAQALAEAGRVNRAVEVFERAAAYVNDVGLLAEEVDPDSGELLGNFPQAFSHIGLVNAAWAVAQARQRAAL
ncbi:glycoside hydrolase family 15 protein [Catellatospora sp. KI3]|uniref:glycoside hydrolase family 15 protein n=1 Tax=Catellatospora sp. KI3 TaxID=3041620 RepID=UPI0024824D8A|nr:glycoside hydrolase family 15 protein [Catellatospora sp. KI3]MDI1462492.1 glycoside hydrolase family 15 protein [Catellatospora sp. KI3]